MPPGRKTGTTVPELQQDLGDQLLAYGFVGCLAATVGCAAWLLSGRGRLLPLQRRRWAEWNGGHVFFSFVVIIFFPGLVQRGLLARGFFHWLYGQEPASMRQQLWASLISFPFIVAIILVTLYLARQVRPADIGLTRVRLLKNIAVACIAWFPLTFVTLTVHFLALKLLTSEDHPLVDLVKNGLLPWEWGLIGVEALAVAPFLEEFIFRGILQQWLLDCSLQGHVIVTFAALAVAGIPYFAPAPDKDPEPEALIFVALLAPAYLWMTIRQDANPAVALAAPEPPFLEDATAVREGPPSVTTAERAPGPQSVLLFARNRAPLPAIYGSSMLWTAFHSSVWPSPIALFLLGLGLGWLAYRTTSLVSSIAVHVLFNTVAFMALFWQS